MKGIRADLSVDWTSHEGREALILDQAQVLYYRWPEVDSPDLP